MKRYLIRVELEGHYESVKVDAEGFYLNDDQTLCLFLKGDEEVANFRNWEYIIEMDEPDEKYDQKADHLCQNE